MLELPASSKMHRSKPGTASSKARPADRPGLSLHGSDRFIPLLLILAAVLAYSNSFSGPFIYDDLSSTRDNPNIRHLWPLWESASAPSQSTAAGRPVVALSLALNYALGGLDVWGYHAFNLGFHILAALLLFGIVRRTLAGSFAFLTDQRTSTWLAASAALIWELHPLASEAVNYVIQRTELLASLFLLLTLYCVIRGSSSRRGWRWYWAAIAACALGMGSKEIMAGAPLIVLFYDRAFLSDSWTGVWRRRGRLYLGLAGTWVLLIALIASGARSETVGFKFNDVGPWQYALTQAGAILYYLRLSLWPYPLSIDYFDWPVAKNFAQAAPGLVAILALLGLTFWAAVRKPRVAFPGLWFFIILAPSSSFVPIVTELVAERRMYLPLAAAVVLILAGAYVVATRVIGKSAAAKTLVVSAIGLAVILGAVTYRRNEDYISELAIWNDVLAKRPDNARAYNNVGSALGREGKDDEAIRHFTKALSILPDYPDALSNLGAMLEKRGRIPEAIALYRKAISLYPPHVDAHYNLGIALQRKGQLDEAESNYMQVLKLAPEYAKARNNLGVIFLSRGRLAEAAAQFTEALRIDPGNPEARQNLEIVRQAAGSTK
jgi:Flp pilus assembly protein TadD